MDWDVVRSDFIEFFSRNVVSRGVSRFQALWILCPLVSRFPEFFPAVFVRVGQCRYRSASQRAHRRATTKKPLDPLAFLSLYPFFLCPFAHFFASLSVWRSMWLRAEKLGEGNKPVVCAMPRFLRLPSVSYFHQHSSPLSSHPRVLCGQLRFIGIR